MKSMCSPFGGGGGGGFSVYYIVKFAPQCWVGFASKEFSEDEYLGIQ